METPPNKADSVESWSVLFSEGSVTIPTEVPTHVAFNAPIDT